jgi:hypothetical protein
MSINVETTRSPAIETRSQVNRVSTDEDPATRSPYNAHHNSTVTMSLDEPQMGAYSEETSSRVSFEETSSPIMYSKLAKTGSFARILGQPKGARVCICAVFYGRQLDIVAPWSFYLYNCAARTCNNTLFYSHERLIRE